MTRSADPTHSGGATGGEGMMLSRDGQKEVEVIHQQEKIGTKGYLYSADWREFVAGWGSGVANITITFPINKIMFRQQLHGIRALEAISQLKREGLISLYRGILLPLTQKGLANSVMFGTYDQYHRILRSHGLGLTACQVTSGMLAGCTEGLVFTPLERVQTIMLDQKYKHRFKNTPHALLSLRLYGFQEYYRGLTAILLRNSVGTALFFLGKEKIRSALPEQDDSSFSFLRNFVTGACLGAAISTLYYPINTTKTHMQKQLGGEMRSFRTVFLELYHDRGIRVMYSGVHVNYTRSFLTWGITNVTYELIRTYLQR